MIVVERNVLQAKSGKYIWLTSSPCMLYLFLCCSIEQTDAIQSSANTIDDGAAAEESGAQISKATLQMCRGYDTHNFLLLDWRVHLNNM